MAQGRISTDDIVVRPGPPEPREGDTLDLDAPGPHDDPTTPAVDEQPPRADLAGDDVPLLEDDVADDFLGRWSEVQARFVDDPQGAVRDGDSLVAELVQALVHRFSQHKSSLEEQWQSGGEPQTEELRRALQQYRSFFQRLLAT